MNTSSATSCISTNLPLKERNVITIYGAGGKTSLLYALGKELSLQGRRVILTTTTKIYRPAAHPCVIGEDFTSVVKAASKHFACNSPVVLGAGISENNKLPGIDPEWPKAFIEQGICDDVIIEGDGAAHKSIKGYASYEPVLPPGSSLLIPVLGCDAIGIPLDAAHVHRPEAFCTLTGALLGTKISINNFLTVMSYMIQIGQEKCPDAVIVPVVNKVDLAEDTQQIRSIMKNFPRAQNLDRLLFTNLKGNLSVSFSFSPAQDVFQPEISVVMLAAGKSLRMGQPKLALKLGKKTLLELALAPVLTTGLRDIVVVANENPAWIKEVIPSNVRIVVNTQSHEGIATSLQVGIKAVSSRSQAIFFSLGDQPFITPDVYHRMIEHYCQHLKSLTFPVCNEKRGNPALFDRRLWPALMALRGDEGGKQIMASIPTQEKEGVPVFCHGIFIDVDTPLDYDRLKGISESQNE